MVKWHRDSGTTIANYPVPYTRFCDFQLQFILVGVVGLRVSSAIVYPDAPNSLDY